MSFEAIENYLVDLFRGFANPQNPDEKIFDHVTISDQSPLTGINSLCVILYDDREETTPLGYGSEEQRYHRTEWVAKIHLMFIPDRIPGVNRFSAEAQNRTISERIGWVQDQLAAYRTLQGYSNYVFRPGENRDKYSTGIDNQIIDTEPTYTETPKPIQFGPPFGNYAGTVFTMKIIEVYHVPNKDPQLPSNQDFTAFFFASPSNDISDINLDNLAPVVYDSEREIFPVQVPALPDDEQYLWFFQKSSEPFIRSVNDRGAAVLNLFHPQEGIVSYSDEDYRGWVTSVKALQVLSGQSFVFSRQR